MQIWLNKNTQERSFRLKITVQIGIEEIIEGILNQIRLDCEQYSPETLLSVFSKWNEDLSSKRISNKRLLRMAKERLLADGRDSIFEAFNDDFDLDDDQYFAQTAMIRQRVVERFPELIQGLPR